MKKYISVGVFALAVSPVVAAVYPATPVQQQQIMYQNTGTARPTYYDVRAVQPSRVTGSLPQVGSNVTNAGRRYYQPQDYDRLVDSGLYLGLSAGYSMSVSGGMTADYAGEQFGYLAPGSFQESTFRADSVIPLQLSLGASINNDVRADFSYTRYGSISYAGNVMTSDGAGGFVNAGVTGGGITSNATMVNVYYNVDSFTGSLAGGSFRPYIGVGVGISLNTISDYVVHDPTLYEYDLEAPVEVGGVAAVESITAYHAGGTTEQLAYMLEGGVTSELEGGLKLDFFARYSGLGSVKSSGNTVVTELEYISDGVQGSSSDALLATYHYTNWTESGRLSVVDLGVRLRLQF